MVPECGTGLVGDVIGLPLNSVPVSCTLFAATDWNNCEFCNNSHVYDKD